MVVEYIRYHIPLAHEASFAAAYADASASLRASPVCLAYELARCEEAREHWILRIEWASTEAHLHGFRRSPEFGPFFAAIRPYVGDIEEMRHYAPTDVVWRR